MGIEKEREAFENLWLAGGGNFDNFIFSEDQGKYAAIENSNLTDKQKEMALYVVNNAYLFFVGGFKQAAKAQAVPESNALLSDAMDAVQKLGSGDFVLVPKEPSADLVNHGHQVFLGHFNEGGQTGGRSIYFAYKAMIEAQEQSHD